jgi:hypothetical protein
MPQRKVSDPRSKEQTEKNDSATTTTTTTTAAIAGSVVF